MTWPRSQNVYNGCKCWVNPPNFSKMNARLIIDKAGRIVLPKPLREELHLEPGNSLEIENAGEMITLRPVRGTGQLRKVHDVWVFHSGESLPARATDEMLQKIRNERDKANLDE